MHACILSIIVDLSSCYRSLQNPCNMDCINFHIWKLMQSVLQGFCKLLYLETGGMCGSCVGS